MTDPSMPTDLPPPDGPETGAPDHERPAEKERHVSAGQILAGILLVVVVVFVAENTRKVTVRLIVPQVTTRLFVPILIAAVLGALIAALMRYRRVRRARRRTRRRRT